MKTIQALAISFVLSFQGYQVNAQQDLIKSQPKQKKWNHELGLNIYSSTIRKGYFYSLYVDHYAGSGLYLRFYRGKNAIRTSVDYFQRINLERRPQSHYHTISLKTFQVAAGYQRHFGHKKMMPYVFADIAYSISNELLRPNWELYLPYDFDYAYPYYYQERSVAWSLTPGMGLRINIKKNLFLNLETAAEIFYLERSVKFTAP